MVLFSWWVFEFAITQVAQIGQGPHQLTSKVLPATAVVYTLVLNSGICHLQMQSVRSQRYHQVLYHFERHDTNNHIMCTE